MAINIADIKTEYGSYYIDAGQNQARVRTLMRHGMETAAFFTPVNTEDSVYRMSESKFTKIVQAFQKQFTEKGTTTFIPRPIETFRQKIDVSETPDDLRRSWLEFLASESLTREDWPLVRFLVEGHIIPQIQEDLELDNLYSGVYAAPTPGTAGDTENAMTGFRKIINDWVDDGTIPAGNVISTGELNTTNPSTFVEQVIDFVKGVNTKYRNRATMQIAISKEFEMHWNQGILEKYNLQNTTMPDGNGYRVPFAQNVNLLFLPSMGDSDKIVMTERGNALMPMKGMDKMGRFKIEENRRTVDIMSDWQLGLGFVLPEAVFTNDRDLAAS